MAVANAPNERLERERDRLEAADVTAGEREAVEGTIDKLGKATSTQAAYLSNLRVFATEVDADVTTLDPTELNDAFEELSDDEGWSDSTEAQYQSALRAFVRRHFDDDDAADAIEITNANSDPSIDPRTVLSPDDHHAMRDVASKDRDRAVIDLFAYTGQRLRVIQTLRYSDVDVDEGVYWMPEGTEGLKGADKFGKKRPLLGARKAVAEWKRSHPTQNPDDPLITIDPEDSGGSEPGKELAPTTIKGILQRMADRAGVEKPVNPHAWRHYFVTIANTQYDMDDGTIKWLIGHSPGSKIMETTYAHLSDDDRIAEARQAMGFDRDDDTTTAAPPACPTCSRPLPPDAEQCPSAGCRERFVPGDDPTEANADDAAELLALLDSADDSEVVAVLQDHLGSNAG